jgi:hypothetical protein
MSLPNHAPEYDNVVAARAIPAAASKDTPTNNPVSQRLAVMRMNSYEVERKEPGATMKTRHTLSIECFSPGT